MQQEHVNSLSEVDGTLPSTELALIQLLLSPDYMGCHKVKYGIIRKLLKNVINSNSTISELALVIIRMLRTDSTGNNVTGIVPTKLFLQKKKEQLEAITDASQLVDEHHVDLEHNTEHFSVIDNHVDAHSEPGSQVNAFNKQKRKFGTDTTAFEPYKKPDDELELEQKNDHQSDEKNYRDKSIYSFTISHVSEFAWNNRVAIITILSLTSCVAIGQIVSGMKSPK